MGSNSTATFKKNEQNPSKNLSKMKKIAFLITTLFVIALVGAGCQRDEPTPTPTPTPTPETYSVVYKVDNHSLTDASLMSPALKMNVTYTDADGQQVTENNVTLPWVKTVDVERPFHAKLTGQITFNEEELPDPVVLVRSYGIGLYVNGSGNIDMTSTTSTMSKENFLKLISEHPDRLQFTKEADF